MDRTEEARKFFEKENFAVGTTGIQIEEAREKYAKCVLKTDERHINANGQVMGGVLFTLGDFAAAAALNDGENVFVSLTARVSFLRTARGDTLTAEAKCVKEGRNICFMETEIRDGEGPCALVSGDWIRQ